MNQMQNNFFNTQLQPQIFSMILITLILIVLSIVIYLKVIKQPIDKAPTGIVQMAEQYVMGVDKLFKNVTNQQLPTPSPYIFTLLTFLIAGNLTPLIGFEAITTSYSTTLTLALISWLGIYVVGLVHKRWMFFLRFVNPLESISQFAPLISMSFRLFGNILGGSIIVYLLYFVTNLFWSKIPIIGEINLLGSLITPVFHAYFDLFSGLIQAYVFTLLTMLYWSLETSPTNQSKVKNHVETSLGQQLNQNLVQKN